MEWHGGQIKCTLPSRGVSLADVFTKIEQNKKEFQIVDYAVSQTSLEQVFLSFAKLQEDEHNVNTPPVKRSGCCWNKTTDDKPMVLDPPSGVDLLEVNEF